MITKNIQNGFLKKKQAKDLVPGDVFTFPEMGDRIVFFMLAIHHDNEHKHLIKVHCYAWYMNDRSRNDITHWILWPHDPVEILT
jgi:hypothetical protein